MRYDLRVEAGELLQRARQRAGLSQADMAARAGTSQPVISAYERGHREPTVPTLRRLVAATGGRLELGVRAVGQSDLPPPVDDEEHGRRLIDVLSLADAVPFRRDGELAMPVLRSDPRPARRPR